MILKTWTFYKNPIIKDQFIIENGQITMYVPALTFDTDSDAEHFCQMVCDQLNK